MGILFIMSHPTRGAWIETEEAEKAGLPALSRTPPGVRGLKLVVSVRINGSPAGRTPPGVRGLKPEGIWR